MAMDFTHQEYLNACHLVWHWLRYAGPEHNPEGLDLIDRTTADIMQAKKKQEEYNKKHKERLEHNEKSN